MAGETRKVTGVTDAAPEDPRTNAAVRVLAARLGSERVEIARQCVARARAEIVDYQSPTDSHLLEDMYSVCLDYIDVLVVSLKTGQPVADEYFERVRQTAGRRVHQGVPLEAYLHAGRVWSAVCWDAVLNVARRNVPAEREAALEVSRHLSQLADRISSVAAQGYLDELTDRGLLRRDLLDALLTGKGDATSTVHLARRLRLRLEDSYAVVVVRGEGIDVEEAREQSPSARSRLDRLVEETRRSVRPSGGTVLTGLRNGELVVLYPVDAPSDLQGVRQDFSALIAGVGIEVAIGISGFHEGRGALPIAYAEAKEAVEIAARLGIHARVVGLDEVLIDHLVCASEPAQRILDDALRPLVDYDRTRQAQLVATLRAYIETRFNITKAAAALYVNPNTVVYRLERIRTLSGRDLHDIDDLLVLILALRCADQHSHRAPAKEAA
jgi:sugar diacid utilization regulator